jgi:hypothetical protein
MENLFGEYCHLKNKYEEAIKEIDEYWKPHVEQRQEVINKYQEWFKQREHLSTVSQGDTGSKIRD